MIDEFWWLKALGCPVSGHVKVARSWWTDPELEDPGWRECAVSVSVLDLSRWAADHRWDNVHRSLCVSDVAPDGSDLHGPFVVDIDANECRFDRDARPSDGQLWRALDIAKWVIRRYDARGIPRDHRRLYFSGHKGFNVEIVFVENPAMHKTHLGWRSERDRLWGEARTELGLRERNDLYVDEPYIDLPYRKGFKRLNGASNRWGPVTRESRCRRMRLGENELGVVRVHDLWVRATMR